MFHKTKIIRLVSVLTLGGVLEVGTFSDAVNKVNCHTMSSKREMIFNMR